MIILNFFLKVVSLLRLKNLVGQRIKNTSRFRGGSAICDSQYKYIVQKFCQKEKGGGGSRNAKISVMYFSNDA